MDEGRKRVIGIMASILASLHMQNADDLLAARKESGRQVNRGAVGGGDYAEGG
jgi:hypothetical protein